MGVIINNFEDYLQVIHAQTKDLFGDCQKMTKLHYFELVGLVATTVAQLELRFFNYFLKSNNLLLSLNETKKPQSFMTSLMSHRCEELMVSDDKQKLIMQYSKKYIDVKGFAEKLNLKSKSGKFKTNDVMRNLISERWTIYIGAIVRNLNINGCLNWFQEARDMRHDLVHSVSSDINNPTELTANENPLKQFRTIFEAKQIMRLAFYADNFSLSNMSILRYRLSDSATAYPGAWWIDRHEKDNDGYIPKWQLQPCHLSRYIEKNISVFCLVYMYNDLIQNANKKLFIGSIATKDDPQHFEIMYGQKHPFENAIEPNNKLIIKVYLDLKNTDNFNDSIFSQWTNFDGWTWEKCGVPVRYEITNFDGKSLYLPIQSIRSFLRVS